jgi:hypothetical protein
LPKFFVETVVNFALSHLCTWTSFGISFDAFEPPPPAVTSTFESSFVAMPRSGKGRM